MTKVLKRDAGSTELVCPDSDKFNALLYIFLHQDNFQVLTYMPTRYLECSIMRKYES
jgi:hypothetical protein